MAFPRYAIYFTPPPSSPLARFGAGILGYDCFERADVPHLEAAGFNGKTFARITADPRKYGFHATLVAPFHVERATEADLLAAMGEFAQQNLPVDIGPLAVDSIGAFIALKPETKVPKVDKLAASLVECFDPYRASLSEADRVRRMTAHLSSRQRELLGRWGYPFVFDQFRFHMTLTNALQAAELPAVKSALAELYNGLSRNHVELDALSLMRQDGAEERFYLVARKGLKGKAR
jgi:putative phosphonate metabolism protein